MFTHGKMKEHRKLTPISFNAGDDPLGKRGIKKKRKVGSSPAVFYSKDVLSEVYVVLVQV